MAEVPWVRVSRDPALEDDAILQCSRCASTETLLASTDREVATVVECFAAKHAQCTASVHMSVPIEGWSK